MKSSSRIWLFRLFAVVLGPLVFLLFAEGTLRLTGIGHPTSFFLPIDDSATETTNPRFGYRFFGPRLARAPVIQTLGTDKGDDEVRIFVLGGSAAMGTPDASFGVAEILQVLLEETYPGVRFVVTNAAMAAVNSHVVLEIARECASRRPDLFLVYLGNNEVVGPFGPGTVFGRFTPSTALVRLDLLVERSRLVQLLEAGLRRFGPSSRQPASWRGMEMFVHNQIAAHDPRLEATYRHFERNLTAIARLGREAGAAVVLSTVATNLKDNPPFASTESPTLGQSEKERLRELRARAVESLRHGESAAAVGPLEQAAELDPGSAETHFLLGVALLGTGDPQGRPELVLARDLDALRFRADSRINRVIRDVAAREDAVLLDAELLLEQSPEAAGLPLGRELLYEHVHFNFLGNYRLARGFLSTLGDLLPKTPAGRTPDPEEVAAALALSPGDAWRMHSSITRLMSRPPFSAQLGHAERSERLALETRRLRAVSWAERETTARLYRSAVAKRGKNLALAVRYAEHLASRQQPRQAEDQWRRLLAEVPAARTWRTGLAFALADQGRLDAARRELEKVALDYPELPASATNLATVLERLGERDTAEKLYRRTLARRPDFEAAALNLGQLLESSERSEEAERVYRSASDLHRDSGQAPFRLASLLDRSARYGEAERWYEETIARDPTMAMAHNNLGFSRERDGRLEQAASAYSRAIEEDPALALPYFNLADLLLQVGQPEKAVPLYRTGLALDPENSQARENLARAEKLSSPDG